MRNATLRQRRVPKGGPPTPPKAMPKAGVDNSRESVMRHKYQGDPCQATASEVKSGPWEEAAHWQPRPTKRDKTHFRPERSTGQPGGVGIM